MYRLATSLALLVTAPWAYAQKFESATITPCLTSVKLATERGELIGWKIEPPYVRAGHASLANLILQAYEIDVTQLQGPAWGLSPISVDSGEGMFDLEAKMPQGATADQVPAMLQSLLVERFKLKVHRNTSEIEQYVLTVSEGGPKFSPAAAPQPSKLSPTTDGGLRLDASSVAEISAAISVNLGRVPTDKTGLKGAFEIHLEIPPTPRDLTRLRTELEFDNMQEALKTIGLSLDRVQVPVEVVVVDQVEREPVVN